MDEKSQKNGSHKNFTLTDKGAAYLAAIEAGLIQKGDRAAFDRFWESYLSQELARSNLYREKFILYRRSFYFVSAVCLGLCLAILGIRS